MLRVMIRAPRVQPCGVFTFTQHPLGRRRKWIVPASLLAERQRRTSSSLASAQRLSLDAQHLPQSLCQLLRVVASLAPAVYSIFPEPLTGSSSPRRPLELYSDGRFCKSPARIRLRSVYLQQPQTLHRPCHGSGSRALSLRSVTFVPRFVWIQITAC